MEQNLTHVKKFRDPNYFGAYELITDWTADGKAISKEMDLTIVKVVSEKVKTQKASTEMVVYFEEVRPMIFNAINTKNASIAIGSPMDKHWAGKKITVYVERIYSKLTKEWVDAVRVRDKAPNAVKMLPELSPTHERWNGAKKAMTDGNTTIEAIKAKFSLTPENEAELCKK